MWRRPYLGTTRTSVGGWIFTGNVGLPDGARSRPGTSRKSRVGRGPGRPRCSTPSRFGCPRGSPGWGGERPGGFDGFLDEISTLQTPFVLVSDEVGLGVVPEDESVRAFRDALGLVNQRAAAAAVEVQLCVAGVGVRIK